MGNVNSFSKSFALPFFDGKFKCFRYMNRNLDALQLNWLELLVARDYLLRWVSKQEEDRGLQVLPEVESWISRVGKIELEGKRLLNISISEFRKVSKSGISATTHRYCQDMVTVLQDIETLRLERFLLQIVPHRIPLMKNMPEIELTVSQDNLLASTWDRLNDEDVVTLGIYGIGGVGKTTLLSQIKHKFSELGGVDVVFFVDVGSKDLQDEIGASLGLQWGQEKTKEERAAEIFSVLENKRVVLLLDNIGTRVDLDGIGVSRGNGCKIVFASRSREALLMNNVSDVVNVDCLPPEEALDLFLETVGETTLSSHHDIPALASIVCEKCHGLPLALTVFGRSMATKMIVSEWIHAVYGLFKYGAEFQGFEDDDQRIFKFSYDNLSDNSIKSCFLYCSLFPADFVVRSQDLINYWVAEELISHEIQGYDIIGQLITASLLVEAESGYDVKMHGMVRQMALGIASHLGMEKEQFAVELGETTREMPKVPDWRMVRRMSVTSTSIENISDSPQCPVLTTLFLQDNKKLKSISGDFFQCMPSLVVLDLSRNRELSELPEEISKLVALRYLSLLGTGIKDLPHGLGKLTRLIHLDLESTSALQSISLISGLLKLQVLRFYGSAAALDFCLLEHLERLKDLKSLTVTVKEVDVLKAFLGNKKLTRCTHGLFLRGLKVSSEASFAATFGSLSRLSKLGMRESNIIESKTEWEDNRRNQSSHQISPSNTWFENLSAVELFACIDLKDLTWLVYAANLESLTVQVSPKMEELISERKASSVEVEPFLKLQVLRLEYLDKLKSICCRSLSFPRLQKVDIKSCPMLHKLPLNSKSVERIDDLRMEVDGEWLKGVEWESKEAQQRFHHATRKPSVSRLVLV